MIQSSTTKLLETLCNAHGAPGAEAPIRRIVADALEGCGALSHDGLGSVLCEAAGSSVHPRIMLDSHLDEVGFMVQSVLSGGWIRFHPLGGWWGHVLLGQRLTVHGANGPVVGVVGAKPPHFLSPAEREKVQSLDQMYLDVGASSAEEVASVGIAIGDPICPDSEFAPMALPGRLRAKAFDNRVGVALMCRALQQFKGGDHPNTLIGVGAVQEEVGCRGAATAVSLARPDLAIVLECTPADDTPGFEAPQARLGAGPQLRLYDPTAIAHRGLSQYIIRTAKAHDIPLQIAVRRSGGTDAKSIHVSGAGIPAAVLGVPARYIHTHNSILDEGDVEQAERLVVALLRELDSQQAEEICRVD